VCLAGARWVQDEILEKNPTLDLKVYMVWLPVYFTDRRSAWDEHVMPDSRVAHYWDEERIVGQWLAEHTNENRDGMIYGAYWDRYFLYSPSVTWESSGLSEDSLISHYPIVYNTDDLLAQIEPFLSG
jgi:hypothetical protein